MALDELNSRQWFWAISDVGKLSHILRGEATCQGQMAGIVGFVSETAGWEQSRHDEPGRAGAL